MSVIIHLGGENPSRELAQEVAANAELIIAADSGYDSCRKNGILPDVVTGDFDSIAVEPDPSKTKIVPAAEQNATDFEKALRLVPQDTRHLAILGGTGLRSDHFLTNLLIAASQPDHRSIVFHDDLQCIYRITGICPFKQNLPLETIVSLIPFSECRGTTSSGLFWNLDGATMGPAGQLGQSNRTSDPVVAVNISEGCLYVVVNRLQTQPVD